MNRIRVRFAPSPTGYLHIGGLRTALYNYLFVRLNGGDFVLRIEDTDQKRFVAEAEQDILDSLDWAGIEYDEGPNRPGEYGPYRQSERGQAYRDATEQLLASGNAYVAYDTEEELEQMRERLVSDENPNPRYDFRTRMDMRNTLSLQDKEIKKLEDENAPFVVRLKVTPGSSVSFTDIVRGQVVFETEHIDDQVLVKSDGMPTYHLANIVDDHLMEISHVIRGEEWLPSTPKHLLLYEALGWNHPEMAHLPLILSPTGGKLSKRSAERAGIPVSVQEYRKRGYEPAALINFLALLGWNPGTEQELFSLKELVGAFSLERVGQSGVQFDLDKLLWFNEQYVRAKPADRIAEELFPILAREGLRSEPAHLKRIVGLMRERISFPADIVEARYFFEDPVAYDEKATAKRWKTDSAELVDEYADRISNLDPFSHEELEATLRQIAEEREIGGGRIIHPVRLAATGVPFGPGLFELLEILGPEAVVRRLRTAAKVLG